MVNKQICESLLEFANSFVLFWVLFVLYRLEGGVKMDTERIDFTDEFESSLRSLFLERIHVIVQEYEGKSKDWWEIQRLIPAIKQQLTPEAQSLFGDLTDLFLVYGFDIGLECYKTGIREMHCLLTDPNFLLRFL